MRSVAIGSLVPRFLALCKRRVTHRANGSLVRFRGGPFDRELRFVSLGKQRVVLSLIHDDEHPQYEQFSGPQEYEVRRGGAFYIGPRPNPTTEEPA